MNTSHPARHLAAATAAAAVLATGAGTAALTLSTTPAAAASPAAAALRTLRDDTLLTMTSGLVTPTARPVARAIAGGIGHNW